MLFIEYPISGPLRFQQLIMEWIFMIACIDLGIFFFSRYIRQDKKLRNLQDLGFSILLLSFGLMTLFFLFGDYFAPNYSIRIYYLILGYYSTMLGAFAFIVFNEKYRKYIFTRYFFSGAFLILIIVFTISVLIDIESSRVLSRYPWPLFIFFFLIYMIEFCKMVQNREKIIIGLLKFVPGFVLLMIGFALTTDTFEGVLGVNLRFYGVLLELIGILFMSFFFSTLPPFSEFEWENKMEHVFLMHKGGISLYEQQLGKHDEMIDKDLVSSAISSVNVLLETLTAEKGVVVINKKGKTIVIYPGEMIYGVMFCSEELNYIKVLLKKLVDRFEALYKNVLIHWNGEISVFEPIKTVVNEILHQ